MKEKHYLAILLTILVVLSLNGCGRPANPYAITGSNSSNTKNSEDNIIIITNISIQNQTNDVINESNNSSDINLTSYNITIDTNNCEELTKRLDSSTNHGLIQGFEGIIGGTIIKISEPYYYIPQDEEQGKTTYTLTFNGINEQGKLYLRIYGNDLKYKLGQFYKFDLANKNKHSMQLSGAFIDIEMNALTRLEECE